MEVTDQNTCKQAICIYLKRICYKHILALLKNPRKMVVITSINIAKATMHLVVIKLKSNIMGWGNVIHQITARINIKARKIGNQCCNMQFLKAL